MSSEVPPDNLQYSFAGKKVLVTGGGRGLGYALVSRLYKDGAQVFVLEKEPELVSKLLQDFPDKSRLTAEICDITQWNQTQTLVKTFGHMNHLVNCVAIVASGDFLSLEEELVDKALDVNLKSMICTSQAVANGMIEGGVKGTIVNVSSIVGQMASASVSLYGITKAAVNQLTKCLAYELGKHGIRTNSISPTNIDTPLYRECVKLDPELVEKCKTRVPLKGKYLLQPDDVVNGILFLLSPLSSMTNGADLVVDGGTLTC